MTQIQHSLIKDSGNHINILTQVPQYLPGIFRSVFKGNQLKLHLWAKLMDLWPQLHQNLCQSHGGCANPYDIIILLHGVFRPYYGIPAVLDDVFCVIIERNACFGQTQPAVGPLKKLYIQICLQKVDLFQDCSRRYVGQLSGLIKAASISYPEKRFKLGIIHLEFSFLLGVCLLS